MAIDIAIKNPDGSKIYYPKTVSDLVYDNETGNTVKKDLSSLLAVNKGLQIDGKDKARKELGYVLHSTGGFTNSTWREDLDAYFIPNDNYSSIKVYTANSDTLANAITFYNSTSYKGDDYSITHSVQSLGTKPNWYEADVPADAKMIVVGCNNTKVDDIIIVLTYRVKELFNSTDTKFEEVDNKFEDVSKDISTIRTSVNIEGTTLRQTYTWSKINLQFKPNKYYIFEGHSDDSSSVKFYISKNESTSDAIIGPLRINGTTNAVYATNLDGEYYVGIRLSTVGEADYKIKVKELDFNDNTSFTALQNSLFEETDITNDSDTIKQTAHYVVYSTGKIQSNASETNPVSVYSYPNKHYKFVKVICYSVDEIPSSIAFYKNDGAITDANYIKDNSVQYKLNNNEYWAEVPEDCTTIATTHNSQFSSVEKPLIFGYSPKYADSDEINNEISAIHENIDEINNEISAIHENIDEINDVIYTTPFKSPHFDDNSGNQFDNVILSFFCDSNKKNTPILNQKIIGIKFYASKSGELSVVKGTIISNNNWTYETLQTYNVSDGLNFLKFNEPIICGENEYLGFSSSSVKISADNRSYTYERNIGCYYNIDGVLKITLKDFVVCFVGVIGSSNIGKEVEDKINAVDKKVDEFSRLKYLPFLDNPYFYHWQPNGFTNGIPSQSVEDNAFAARLGFKFVECNNHLTATKGKYIVTHGASGTFGAEFAEPYKSMVIADTPFDYIMENVKYNSPKECYNHRISSIEDFCKSAYSLGLGITLRTDEDDLINIVRSYLPDSRIVMFGKNGCRERTGFKGVLTSWANDGDSSTYPTKCTYEWLKNYAETHGGGPFHLAIGGPMIEYMLDNGTLDEIVAKLRNDEIYLGASYVSAATAEKLIAAGGCGIGTSLGMIGPFRDFNYGSWSALNTEGWTIPEGITVQGGKLINNTSEALVVKTPSTDVLPLGKGMINARVKGNIKFTLGEISDAKYYSYDENKLICLAAAGINKDMRLSITIDANSSVEYLDYYVSRC